MSKFFPLSWKHTESKNDDISNSVSYKKDFRYRHLQFTFDEWQSMPPTVDSTLYSKNNRKSFTQFVNILGYYS